MMAFKKIDTTGGYPPRFWSLCGYPGAGKSTFSAQMAGPLLCIDSDGRFVEVVTPGTEVFTLTENFDAEKIAEELRAGMPGSGVRTIVVDSLTSIISPLVTAAILDNDAGRNKNRVSAFKAKALAVRLLQDAVTAAGVDTLWIYHLRDGMDAKARKVESTSISTVELARLRRSLNLSLRVVVEDGKRVVVEDGKRVVVEDGKRGIVVDWARRGRSGMTLWDKSTHWAGMPEKIERAVYGGLSAADMDKTEKRTPKGFASPEDAIAWGWETGMFRDARHAKNAYEKVKVEEQPKTAEKMFSLWVDNVTARQKQQLDPRDIDPDWGDIPQEEGGGDDE